MNMTTYETPAIIGETQGSPLTHCCSYAASHQPTSALRKSVVIYELHTRDRTQGFLHTGDFACPDVETKEELRLRRRIA